MEQTQSTINLYFDNNNKDYIYKANIEAFGNYFSGIFIVKKLEESHHRIVFTTEMGNKIFDFSFQEDTFKVNHILKKMDKNVLVSILKNDFKVLLTKDPTVEKTFIKKMDTIYATTINKKTHYHFISNGKLNKVIRVGNGKAKVIFLFSEINDDIAKNIQISHQNIRLSITLKLL